MSLALCSGRDHITSRILATEDARGLPCFNPGFLQLSCSCMHAFCWLRVSDSSCITDDRAVRHVLSTTMANLASILAYVRSTTYVASLEAQWGFLTCISAEPCMISIFQYASGRGEQGALSPTHLRACLRIWSKMEQDGVGGAKGKVFTGDNPFASMLKYITHDKLGLKGTVVH